jgi:DNA helicase-2/ATP-dependent DNA helicase PcrA
MSLPEFYDQVLIRTGYALMLESKPTEENKTRLENVKELKSSIAAYMQNAEVPSLAGFLEEIALYTDIEEYNDSDDTVVMMTMHSAKGLEFPNVYLVGFEDGLFPGTRVIGDREEMEEERRLCYVAITRAKKNLTISYARQRMLYGRTTPGIQSRFLKEIPENLTIKKGSFVSAYSTPRSYSFYNDDTYTPPKPAGYMPKIPTATSPSASKAPAIVLYKGDMVQHTAFGKGMVLTVLKMGGDAMLEIAFDKIGTKKLMLNAAAPHLKKLS